MTARRRGPVPSSAMVAATATATALALVLSLGAPRVHAAPLTVVDDTGARIAFKDAPRRIVSLSPGATELLFAAGAGDRIVATVTGADEPVPARRIERIGDANALVFPRLRDLKPDVVVVWKDLVAPGILDSLAKMQLTVYTVSLRRFEDIPRSVRRLGALAGTLPVAEREARILERKVARLPPRPPAGAPAGQGARAPVPQRVFYMMLDSPLYTVGSRHLVDDAIARCGGRNIFEDIDYPAPIVEFEEIRKRDPEIIVMSAPPITARDWRERWQPFKAVAAVRGSRLIAHQDPRLERMGPSAIEAVDGFCRVLARGGRAEVR